MPPKARRTPPIVPPEELDSLVIRVLEGAGDARLVTQIFMAIPAGLRPAAADVKIRLEELVRHGRVFRWRAGRSPLYAAKPLSDQVRTQVLRLVEEGPQTEGELRKAVGSRAAAGLGQVLSALVAERRLYLWPKLPKMRTATYALAPPDVLDLLRPDLEALVKSASKRGFRRDDVLEACRRFAGVETGGARLVQTDLGARVLAAVEELNPQAREGALVFLPHLRTALAGEIRDKAAFDRVVLGLLARGKIQLQSHAVPGQLGSEEREQMIPDGQGSFYMAIGLRR